MRRRPCAMAKKPEGKRRQGKEIHGGNCLAMIGEERCPTPRRFGIPRLFPHPTQYGSLGDIEAKHSQLTLNARRAPGKILGILAEDQLAQFPADAFSSHMDPMPREPRPLQLEPSPVPTNNSLRLDENERPLPARPEPPKDHPKDSVRNAKPPLRTPSLQEFKLFSQRQVLQSQTAA